MIFFVTQPHDKTLHATTRLVSGYLSFPDCHLQQDPMIIIIITTYHHYHIIILLFHSLDTLTESDADKKRHGQNATQPYRGLNFG